MEKIVNGTSTPQEFIAFIQNQNRVEDLGQLDWAERPIWKAFLSTDPSDYELHTFLLAYQELGGDLFEMDRYHRSVFEFRLTRAKNTDAFTLEVLLSTFELAGSLDKIESKGKAFWEYCIYNEWDESEKLKALSRYHKLGGDCRMRGEYGTIFKYMAEIPSIPLWKLVASWVEVVVEDEFVVGGEGEGRIAFCDFLAEQDVPISKWGGLTVDYAFRDDDFQLLDKVIALGWKIDLDDPDIYARANSIEAYQKLLDLGVSLNPDSNYPGDFPVYLSIYNLSGRLKRYYESSDDYYLDRINRDKEILKLLLQHGARLDVSLEYDAYPPLRTMLLEYPEIYEMVKAHSDEQSVSFLEQELGSQGA